MRKVCIGLLLAAALVTVSPSVAASSTLSCDDPADYGDDGECQHSLIVGENDEPPASGCEEVSQEPIPVSVSVGGGHASTNVTGIWIETCVNGEPEDPGDDWSCGWASHEGRNVTVQVGEHEADVTIPPVGVMVCTTTSP